MNQRKNLRFFHFPINEKRGSVVVNKTMVALLIIMTLAVIFTLLYKADVIGYVRLLPGYKAPSGDEIIVGSDGETGGRSCPYRIAELKPDSYTFHGTINNIFFCENPWDDPSTNECKNSVKTPLNIRGSSEDGFKLWLWGPWSPSSGVVGDMGTNGKISFKDNKLNYLIEKFGKDKKYKQLLDYLPLLEGSFVSNMREGNVLCREDKNVQEETKKELSEIFESYSFEAGCLMEIKRDTNTYGDLARVSLDDLCKYITIPVKIKFLGGGNNQDIYFIYNARVDRVYSYGEDMEGIQDRDFWFKGDFKSAEKIYKYLDEDEFLWMQKFVGASTFEDFAEGVALVGKEDVEIFVKGSEIDSDSMGKNTIISKIIPYEQFSGGYNAQAAWLADWTGKGKYKSYDLPYSCDFAMFPEITGKNNNSACLLNIGKLSEDNKIEICEKEWPMPGQVYTSLFGGKPDYFVISITDSNKGPFDPKEDWFMGSLITYSWIDERTNAVLTKSGVLYRSFQYGHNLLVDWRKKELGFYDPKGNPLPDSAFDDRGSPLVDHVVIVGFGDASKGQRKVYYNRKDQQGQSIVLYSGPDMVGIQEEKKCFSEADFKEGDSFIFRVYRAGLQEWEYKIVGSKLIKRCIKGC
jgi:hypothetical protein